MATGERGHPVVKEMMVLDVQTKPPRPHWYELYLQPCVAELLGTALFVFTGCLSVLKDSRDTGLLQPALAHGLALGPIISILGGISGGHLNPAASLAVWLAGGLNITMLIPYWLSQLCGGVIGAGLAKAVVEQESYRNSTGGAFSIITSDEQVPSALVNEVIMTSFLFLVVCMGAVNGKTKSPLAPVCIGFTVTATVLAGGSVSGACMNPARAFGPALLAGCWDYHWVYWVGPTLAALLVSGTVR
ncbi:aquaporin-8 [Dryobates pubescens]|nr:aquaporin-8 [Dryobates pubescens]